MILVLFLLGIVATGFGALKVAIVAGDAIGDRGFTDMAYIGIQEAEKQFDIEYKVFECHVDPSKYFDSLRAAAMNYDLIFVDPGYFFDKELAEVSAMFLSKK
jgi:basic membrane lipoprotein Med (substrate-binding protein (PBP1-ABC) superfamily)